MGQVYFAKFWEYEHIQYNQKLVVQDLGAEELKVRIAFFVRRFENLSLEKEFD